MIGRLEKTVLDCPDPQALAAFYAELLGMRVNEDDGDFRRRRGEPRHPGGLDVDEGVDLGGHACLP